MKKVVNMDMEYLKYKIRKKGMKMSDFSYQVGMTKSTLYTKLNGERQWKYYEMKKTKDTLDLSVDEFNKIFGF